ncbi:Kdo hydroxylase family protein [Acerihabitans sp. TG2]|uniref:Kdo hydroxylase family protein n=1 Tax=Acerihabitans sp. TG2 TaxID=3096008 RepID=UPI002B23E491|nr:Kdo hydroxylase family protein [Acerihabitans sp. TG2]MEA9391594.1 Kdo hydroxylase family protein [Acerihabitans sp. TG2]
MPTSIAFEQAVMTLSPRQWNESGHDMARAVDALEQGKVLFFPHLSFPLTLEEVALLDPQLVDVKRKNISFQPLTHHLKGVASAAKSPAIRQLLTRYYQQSCQLVAAVLPDYQQVLHSPTNTLRLHPITAWRDTTSWRKDDSRLHVDAFPSRPTRGERIMRIFTNINPSGQNRVWRVGEPFPALAQRFLPRLKRYSPLVSWVQHRLGITKTRRSHYDHLMLQLHDSMKADQEYQQHGPQLALEFPPGSSWICFSDQTPHAAMSGQFMLEQTFLLSPASMQDQGRSPLRVLESLAHQPLV